MRLVLLTVLVAACGTDEPSVVPPEASTTVAPARQGAHGEALNPRLLRRFRPLHVEPDKPGAIVELGRLLYFEARLSASHDISCNSCHPLDKYGTDGAATSTGFGAQRGTRNAPTTYHASGMIAQFWDGRSPDVERQAIVPIMNPVEMASTETRVLATLRSIPEYGERFTRAFPTERDPITLANVGRAIGAFERRLLTPSRWDRYLQGDKQALAAVELEGMRIFTNIGCITCHTGELVGGTSFQRVGIVEPWPNATDRGRVEVTKDPADDMVFRVPSLRNIAMTAPYFHDGSAATLEDAVKMMGRHQLGLELDPAETASIVVWLRSMTGELPTAYIEPPVLPPSTATTPRPDERANKRKRG
jgi:cytochrome c peroxidase